MGLRPRWLPSLIVERSGWLSVGLMAGGSGGNPLDARSPGFQIDRGGLAHHSAARLSRYSERAFQLAYGSGRGSKAGGAFAVGTCGVAMIAASCPAIRGTGAGAAPT